MKTNKGLTARERQVLKNLSDAWNSFVKLQSYHPDEANEMRQSIHACQHIIGCRVACRANPEVWGARPNAPVSK
jgi:hypothetical protein